MAYYASPDERDRLIDGFRTLAEFLQDHPDVAGSPLGGCAGVPARWHGRGRARRNRCDSIAYWRGNQRKPRRPLLRLPGFRPCGIPGDCNSRNPGNRRGREVRAVTITVAILALAIFLSGAVQGVLALLAVSIWTGSRGRQFPLAPRTLSETVTHRLLGVGVRCHRNKDEEG